MKGMKEVVAVTDEGLGNTSWMVDLGDGRALVVDPARHPGPYLAEAARRRLCIAVAAETHLHADFLSGSRELAARGASVVAPAAGGLAWPHRPLGDGDEVDLGGLTLRPLATPGHTPEHLAYLVLDGSRPLAVFTGGSLIVGAVARTDLISPERTEELTRALWRSIREQLLTLPDDVLVYPTHGAGSFCSAPTGGERWTTIGAERTTNPLLLADDEDTFVTRLLAGLGTYPPYFLRLRERNRSGPAVLGPAQPGLSGLDAEAVRRLVGEGAELVDVRPVPDFAAGHIPGALSIPLRPQFASWLGWLVSDERPLVFVLDGDQDRAELVRQCLGIGYEHLSGELHGGMAAWEADGLPVQRLPLMVAAEVEAPAVLDVRQESEFREGHLPGAVHVELGSLHRALDEVPSGPAVVMCGHGERATTAASLLARAGRHDITVAVGGPADWATRRDAELEQGR